MRTIDVVGNVVPLLVDRRVVPGQAPGDDAASVVGTQRAAGGAAALPADAGATCARKRRSESPPRGRSTWRCRLLGRAQTS